MGLGEKEHPSSHSNHEDEVGRVNFAAGTELNSAQGRGAAPCTWALPQGVAQCLALGTNLSSNRVTDTAQLKWRGSLLVKFHTFLSHWIFSSFLTLLNHFKLMCWIWIIRFLLSIDFTEKEKKINELNKGNCFAFSNNCFSFIICWVLICKWMKEAFWLCSLCKRRFFVTNIILEEKGICCKVGPSQDSFILSSFPVITDTKSDQGSTSWAPHLLLGLDSSCLFCTFS